MKALRIAALMIAVAAPAMAAAQQDDPFRALRSYDFQDRRALDAVQARVREAGKDPARLAAIELRLIEVLKDHEATFAARQEVCKLLAVMGSARSVPTLEAMLAGDPKVSNVARYALEGIPAPEAAAALRRQLGRTGGLARVGIINSLGVKRDAQAVPALTRMLQDSAPEVRGAAQVALARIATPQAMAALQAVAGKDPLAAQSLVRCAAALALQQKSAAALQTLRKLTGRGFPAVVRVAALRALLEARQTDAPQIGLTLMREPSVFIQRGAGAAVARLGTSASAGIVAKAWAGLPVEAKVALLHGWADRKMPAAAALATQQIKAGAEGALQEAAVRALQLTGGATAVPLLAELAGRGTPAAREALARMSGAGISEAILRSAREGTADVRAAMMQVLKERPGADSMAALLQAARDREAKVAIAALGAVSEVGGAGELAALVDLFTTAESQDRLEAGGRAIVACAQRADARGDAVAPLVARRDALSPEARVVLAGVLAELAGPQALEALRSEVASDNEDVRRAAVQALADTWPDGSARPLLAEVAGSSQQRALRVLALRGFIRLTAQDGALNDEAKTAELEKAVRLAERPEEKRQVLGALRDCRTAGAVALAASLLDDAEVRTDAAETILDLAAPQKRNNRDLPAVRGEATSAAIERILQIVEDNDIKERAARLR